MMSAHYNSHPPASPSRSSGSEISVSPGKVRVGPGHHPHPPNPYIQTSSQPHYNTGHNHIGQSHLHHDLN